jgi:hypothetical protein
MITVVMIRVERRPIRSPRWPNRTPPNGRTTKPTPKVAKAAIVPAAGSASVKKSWLKTRAAAVP